jgi:two-component system, OmpR family, sensor histidine kinase SenX3
MFSRWPIRSHFIAFFLLSAVATAQLSWWVIFQVREGTRVAHIQTQLWAQQLDLARERAHDFATEDKAGYAAWLTQAFPDLEQDPRGRVVVRNAALHRLDRMARDRVRMFVSEGIFFSLLLLLGVLYMYWILRRELLFERRQSAFLAATSHELKTPITSLRLYLDTLVERDLPLPQQREMLATMRKDLERLTDLIQRLLQAQALIGGKLPAKLEKTDLSAETRIVMDEVYGRFDLKGFQVRSRLEPDLIALAHPERWRGLVRNLLENAFKYSPDGGVIEIILLQRGHLAQLEVTDQGIGIPPAELERIFGRFYRVGNEDTRRAAGTGLGLYLVREIAESFGGKATAASAGEGKGATFTVTVPLLKETAHD